ncbi:MAG: hypothetical protein H0U74_17095 [Bradymonadaceae bacterium]|nr:hypothetical protein [Lujinxingiaceae bacterium]
MKYSTLPALLTLCLLTLSLLAACAPPNAPRPALAEVSDQNCVQDQMLAGRIVFRTCLVSSPHPTGMRDDQEYRPQIATVVRSPAGAFGNPMIWTVEVRRNGELVMRRALDDLDLQVLEHQDSLEIESVAPLGGMREMEPGRYVVTYSRNDGSNESVSHTIVIEDEGEEAP